MTTGDHLLHVTRGALVRRVHEAVPKPRRSLASGSTDVLGCPFGIGRCSYESWNLFLFDVVSSVSVDRRSSDSNSLSREAF